MRPCSWTRFAVLIVLAAASAILASCGGDEGPTYPPLSGPGTRFASPNLPPMASWAHTFPDTGVFGYHCGLHPSIMKNAAVVVTATAPSSAVPVSILSLATPGFSPDTARVLPGGTVTWRNDHTTTHSVESD
jgi:hypothetical protein